LSEPTFWADHLHPDDREWAVRFCEEALAEKRDHDFEYRMIAADGGVVWVRDLVTVVTEGDRATRLRGGHGRHHRAEAGGGGAATPICPSSRAWTGSTGRSRAPNDLEQMMSDVLDEVLSIFDCDRAWLVYPCDPEASSWQVPMEHTRPEYPGVFGLGRPSPWTPRSPSCSGR